MLWNYYYVQSLVDHLAEVEGLVGELSPAAVEDDLKDGAHESASRLQRDTTQAVKAKQQHSWCPNASYAEEREPHLITSKRAGEKASWADSSPE